MIKVRLLVFCLLSISLFACTKKHSQSVDKQCQQNIKLSTQIYQEKQSKLKPVERKRIESLLTAAKIQQQHQQYTACIDSTYRIHVLLDYDPKKNKTNKN